MKPLFIILLLLYSQHLLSQTAKTPAKATSKGYATIGFIATGNKQTGAITGANFGMGFVMKSVSTGALIDAYFLSGKDSYFILSADFRAYIKGFDKKVTPFIAAQPGTILYNKKVYQVTVKGKGSFCLLAGVRTKPVKKSPGFVFAVGYQLMSFAIITESTRSTTSAFNYYGGAKLNMGVIF